MLGIVVQIIISWLLIWLVERRSLSVLGLQPTGRRLKAFLVLFLITAFLCSTSFLMRMFIVGQKWQVNPDLTGTLAFDAILWNIRSVLFEELMFRGVLLYILIRRIGVTAAIWVSAIAFGIYHWFSFGVFGQIIPMIFIFIITGAMGLLLAFGYARTLSMYAPIAIHLGWNITQIFIFSDGPIGNGVFFPTDGKSFRTTSYLLFFTITILPMLAVFLTNYLMIRKMSIDQK